MLLRDAVLVSLLSTVKWLSLCAAGAPWPSLSTAPSNDLSDGSIGERGANDLSEGGIGEWGAKGCKAEEGFLNEGATERAPRVLAHEGSGSMDKPLILRAEGERKVRVRKTSAHRKLTFGFVFYAVTQQ